MRALLLSDPGPIEERDRLELVELPSPVPGPGQVRIRVHACGICHTDLHQVEGELKPKRLPVIPGHQIVGVIDGLGSGVSGNRLGQRVGLPWLHSACLECRYCKHERENLCESGRFTGWHEHGGYAEQTLAQAGFVVPLPDGFADLATAPLLCGGVIGYRALRLSGIRPGGKLGLYGFGNSAHVAIQIARHWSCESFVFTRSTEHQQHAIELGAVWAGSADDDPGAALDASIIFAPAGPLVLDALRVLDRGGTLALAGIHMSPIPQLDYRLIYGERTLRSVANATRQDARELLELAATIPIRTDVERYTLEQGNEVMGKLKRSEIRGGAVFEIA